MTGGSNASLILEKDIQKISMEWLELQPKVALVWRNGLNHKRFNKYSGRGKAANKGIPDNGGMFYGGKLFAIEFKKPGGKTRVEQTEFLQKIENAGGYSLRALSLEDVMIWYGKVEKQITFAHPSS